MKIKFTQFKWLVTMLLLVTAMAMPEMAWAEKYNENGFAEDGSYQPATLTTDKYDIDGNDTKDEVYEIGNAGQLYWFAALVNGTLGGETKNASANAKLTADITVNTSVLKYDGTPNNNGSGFETWIPIGNDLNPYAGTFDGKGHTISGLYFNYGTTYSYIGLFGYNNGTIKNVGVVDSYFCGKQRVGGVCGHNNGGKITGCYNTGTISGNQYVGGVCGINGGTITNCYYLSGTATGGIGSNDVAGSAEAKTTTQFESGEVCYLLNEGKTDGTQIWYQNLSAEGGDAYPHLNDTDKENTTVYGAYKHGETTLTYRNDNNNTHAHPYDSSAADEANGNHDKSYQGNFNWADNDDKTDATVTATFTCSVCGKVETLELTAVHDDEHPNTPAACTEVGYNYFKTSHAFAGAIFTDSYKQTVPVLGHNMNEITFNEVKKIYSNQCQRENCGYIGYYATSDESVEAKLEDGIYKVESFTLADATAYNSEAEFTATSLAYKRTFYDDKWMAVYVPFAINCSKLESDYEMATINNFHEYEQEDGKYNLVLEVKRVTKGGTIPALTPCLMRMKTAPAAEVEKTLTFENAAFSAAADKSIDCSSVTRYYKFTGSLNGKTGLTPATDFVLDAGKLYKTSKSTVLLPQRWYLSATDRPSTPVEPATMLRSISINVIGDGEATGIEDIQVNTESGADASGSTGIYDLQGRKIISEPTKGMYIKNGKKYIK